MADETTSVPIRGDAIALGDFLKVAGAAGSGGAAKHMVQGGLVRVNGAPEARRGHKVRPGDVVDVEGAGRFTVARENGAAS